MVASHNIRSNQGLKKFTFPSLASLTLVACGGGGGLIVAPPPANRAPVAATDKTLSMDEDTTNTALNITAPSDVDGDNLTITVTAVPTGGTLTLADGTKVTVNSTLTVSQLTGLVFTPDANLNDDTTTFGAFTYTVSDGSLTDSSTVTISVTPVNDAPELVGIMEFAVDENTTAVADITATDVDDDPLTYSITGGADQTLFAIDASTGALSFKTAPDYENPGDSDQDNIYLVEITVSDGFGGRATDMCVIRVRDTLESGRSLESGTSQSDKYDQIDSGNEDYINGFASEYKPLDLNETERSFEDIVLPETVPSASLSPLLSEEDTLDLLTELIDPTLPVSLDYENTLMIDQNDQVSSVEQPREHAMIKVDSISSLLFMDNCNTMLDDTNLIVISELG